MGRVYVIDDCYNANPASTSIALSSCASHGPKGSYKVAVLGDMLELGALSPLLHARALEDALGRMQGGKGGEGGGEGGGKREMEGGNGKSNPGPLPN